jgi:ABC-2 type transport system ATP-binding protein
VPAVEVRSLVKRYPGVLAVSNMTWQAEAGEVTTVLGPNGAGKTTTIEICAGLQRGDGGSVSVLGLDPQRDAVALRPRVGVMPQGGSTASGIYPAARVREVLDLYAALHADPIPVDSLLVRLGLDHRQNTSWRQLSGGEQQRLSLALALVGRPEVLFLDEPTAGLDVAGRRATWDLIGALRTAGVAIVLTTHALEEAEQLSDAIVIVSAGQVVGQGTLASLTGTAGGQPESQVLGFDAPAGLPLAELTSTLGDPFRASEPTPGHYRLEGAVTPDVVATLTAWCAARSVMPDHLTTGMRSLEDVFLELTDTTPRPTRSP